MAPEPVDREPKARLPFLSRMLTLPWVAGAVREGMVENRPYLTFITHAVLWIGVAIVAFPVYVTFVASTLTAEQVLAIGILFVVETPTTDHDLELRTLRT